MIGIGITTTSSRPDHLKLCLAQIEKHTKGEYKLHVAKDFPTIARAKNDCLWNLKECEHIFLFDDDCFPIADGWEEFISGLTVGHLLYLTDRHKRIKGYYRIVGGGTILGYEDAGGCFMYLSGRVFRAVGYMNTDYKQYGFEHCAYSNRVQKAYRERGIDMPVAYHCPVDMDKYLYSLDYQGTDRWLIDHKPSITDFKAMQESIDFNRKVYEKEINSTQIYYDYKP
jgi:hypothetical protein